MAVAYQPPPLKMHPRAPVSSFGRTEVIPVKDPHTRIKPLALTNGYGRYITATPERALVFFGEWPLHMAVINL
jgi:hypothetical protein